MKGGAGTWTRGLAPHLLCTPELPGVWEAQPVMALGRSGVETRVCEATAAKTGTAVIGQLGACRPEWDRQCWLGREPRVGQGCRRGQVHGDPSGRRWCWARSGQTCGVGGTGRRCAVGTRGVSQPAWPPPQGGPGAGVEETCSGPWGGTSGCFRMFLRGGERAGRSAPCVGRARPVFGILFALAWGWWGVGGRGAGPGEAPGV